MIIERWRAFVAGHPNARLFTSLGQARFYSLLSHADLMVGNSSGGLWETPSFRLPTVNIGDRQRGRFRAANVLDTPAACGSILSSIRRGLDPSFRRSLADIANPMGDGQAAPRIARVLAETPVDVRLLRKGFSERS